MNCPRCGKKIRVDDADLGILIAKCAACQNVFDFGPLLPPLESAPTPIWPKTRPDGYHIKEDDDACRQIVIDWFSVWLGLVVMGVLLWNAFFWLILIMEWPHLDRWVQVLQLLLALIPHVIGIFMIYATIAAWKNTTTLTVTNKTLSVKHGPIYWPGNFEVSTDDVRGFYCVAHGEPGLEHSQTVHLKALLADGTERKLLTAALPEVIYAKRKLEQWLKLSGQGGIDGLPTLRQAHSQ